MEDLYGDLETFDFGKKIIELETNNKVLEEKLMKLKSEYVKLVKDSYELKIKSENLESNISSLYKTATTELSRKDRIIAELRSELDNVIFQKSRRQNFRRPNDASYNNNRQSNQDVSQSAPENNLTNDYRNVNKSNRENIMQTEQDYEEPCSFNNDNIQSQSTDVRENSIYHQRMKMRYYNNKVETIQNNVVLEEVQHEPIVVNFDKKNSSSIPENQVINARNEHQRKSRNSPLRHNNRRSPNRYDRNRRQSRERKRSRSKESRKNEMPKSRIRSNSRERSKMHKGSRTSSIQHRRNDYRDH